MKRIILYILLILCISSQQSFAGNYLKLFFSSQSKIPQIGSSNGHPQIIFIDPRLTELFSRHSMNEFAKEYPTAYSFPDTILQAQHLKLVFRVRLSSENRDSLINLRNELTAINSSDISNSYVANDPVLLGVPNDYNNLFSIPIGEWPEAYHHLNLIRAEQAWDVTRGQSCIKVGITDAGFRSHVDVDNKVEITSNSITPFGTTGFHHGTEVASLVGGETNNNLGISSLGYNVVLQYYNDDVDGVLKAIYNQCKVVNMSWGESCSPSSSLLLPPQDWEDLISIANLYKVALVAAAGNGYSTPGGVLPVFGTNIPNCQNPSYYIYPASYNDVISVTSVGSQWNVDDIHLGNWRDCHRQFFNPADTLGYKSTHQHNSKVDICAPGYWVRVAGDLNGYNCDGGTSVAAPQVSAAAALLYSLNPDFTPLQIKNYLKNNAANIYGVYDNYLWTGLLGSGRLDAGASLLAAAPNATIPNTISDISWFGNKPGSTIKFDPIANNDYLHYNVLKFNLSFSSSSSCSQGRLINWIIKWGDEEVYRSGINLTTTTVNLITEFTTTTPPRSCNPIEVFVNYGDACNDLICNTVSPFYKESGGFPCEIEQEKNSNIHSNILQNLSFNKLKIYPNPVVDNLNLMIASSSNNKVTVVVSDLAGKIIMQNAAQLVAGENQMHLNVKALAKGSYSIKVVCADGCNSPAARFVKQ